MVCILIWTEIRLTRVILRSCVGRGRNWNWNRGKVVGQTRKFDRLCSCGFECIFVCNLIFCFCVNNFCTWNVEKARLQAEAKAAQDAQRRAEAEAAAEAKRKRELDREAARQALLQVNYNRSKCRVITHNFLVLTHLLEHNTDRENCYNRWELPIPGRLGDA